MRDRWSSRVIDRPLPRLTRLGLLGMAVGFVFDLIEHGLVAHTNEVVVAGFPVAEHAAHLVVMVGMILVLAGIVIDGARAKHGRLDRPRRSESHAIR